MNELIKKRLNNSLGKTILIFTNNDFRYEGKLTNADDDYAEVLDYKSNSYRLIKLSDIKHLEVKP